VCLFVVHKQAFEAPPLDPWSTFQYVGTALSLVAFVVAVGLFGYRARLTQRARIIQSAPSAERLKAIAATAEFFNVDVSGLSPEHQQQIVMAQIQLRARRELLLTGASLVVAILLSLVAVTSILTSRSTQPENPTASAETKDQLERAWQAALILKATDTPKREDQIRNLKFFIEAGFIRDPDSKIAKMPEDAFPSLPVAVGHPADIYRQFKEGVGLIKTTFSDDEGRISVFLGTCFVVSKDGYALTAAQMVHQMDRKVGTISGSLGSPSSAEVPAEVITTDSASELALIKLSKNLEYLPLRLSREQAQTGDPATIMGYPLGEDLLLVSGTVGSVNGPGGKLAITVQATAGQAGSPVLNKNGDVGAVIINTSNEVTYAIPLQFARSLLKIANLN
jgi:S1-C subfamily serine protease